MYRSPRPTERPPEPSQQSPWFTRLVVATVALTLVIAAGCAAESSVTDIADADSSGASQPAADQSDPAETVGDSSDSTSDDSQENGDDPLADATPSDGGNADDDGMAATPTSGDAAVSVVGFGDEPRTLLTRDNGVDHQKVIEVYGAESIVSQIGDERREVDHDATIEWTVTSEPSANGSTVTLAPNGIATNVTDPPDTIDMIPWTWEIDSQGTVLEIVDGPLQSQRVAMHGLLAVPDMILAVPSEPVGPGAVWQLDHAGIAGARATYTLISVSDDHIEASIRIEHSTDNEDWFSGTSGRWDRATLTAVELRSEAVLDYENTFRRDGAETTASGLRTSIRLYNLVESS